MPNNSEIEAAISELLNDLTAIQQELLDVLGEKRRLMAASDLEAMHALQAREEELSGRLKACHHRRQELLASAGRDGHAAESLSALADVISGRAENPLRKQASKAAARMRLLQHQSITNWVVAQRSLLHISRMLEIIATGGKIQPTYSKSESNQSRGGLVDWEA